MLARRWLRRVRRRWSAPARGSAARYGDAELLARAEEFNQSADRYWKDLAAEPSGRRHALNKPFSGLQAAPEELYRLGLLLSELKLGVGLTVLDFGAGSCWLASCLNRLGCRTVAVDVSPAALDLGRELFALDSRHRPELEPRFLHYDGHRIPLPDGSVDRIACFDAFHHVPNQDEVLREMFRVLRWGGRAVLSEPGEGHTHSDLAAFDEQRYGVLENELDPVELEGRARRAGFTDVTLKPYPHTSSLSSTPRDYMSIIDGDVSRFPVDKLADDLRGHFTFTLAKGEHVPDSRCPGTLRAAMRLIEPAAPLVGIGGRPLPLLLELRNEGDTLWRHAADPVGGQVLLGSHLLDDKRRLVRIDFHRAALPADLPPGEAVQLLVQMPLPPDPGRYVLRLDPVDDQVTWFSQAGSPVLDLDVRVDANADIQRLAARLERLDGEGPISVHAGGRRQVRLRVTNLGPCLWPLSSQPGPGAIRLGGQLKDASDRTIERDLIRLDLPRSLGVDEAAEVEGSFRAPETPGGYVVHLDMLQEEVCWFAQRGSQPLEIALDVTGEVPDSTDPGILRARIEVVDPGPRLEGGRGEAVPIRIRVTNAGNTRWRHTSTQGRGHVALGGRLVADAAPPKDHFRARLPRDVDPGDTVEVMAEVPLPERAGRYRLMLDMVDEGIAWFAWEHSPGPTLEVVVL